MTKTVYWNKVIYIYTTLVQVSSKSNIVLIIFFEFLFSSLGDDSCQAPGDYLSHFSTQNTLSLSSFLHIFLMLSFRKLRFMISFSSNLCLMNFDFPNVFYWHSRTGTRFCVEKWVSRTLRFNLYMLYAGYVYEIYANHKLNKHVSFRGISQQLWFLSILLIQQTI